MISFLLKYDFLLLIVSFLDSLMMDFPKMIESQKVRKQVKLEYLPHVLVIHIGRFSFDFKSNTALKVSEPLVRWYQT